MNILITGAGGQLGRDCARVLATKNTVYAFGSKDLDISDHDQVRGYFQEIRPDVVVNCAAYTAVDGCETDRENCWRVNARGPGVIASSCSEAGARLIHISTDYVFDGRKAVPEPYSETEPVHPLSQYGASKLAGEEEICNRITDHLIIRTAWLYGIGGRNFLKTMLRLALSDPSRPIRVVNDQYGSLTWTHRLAHQINTLLTKDMTGTVHATAEGHATWYDGARFFLEAMKVPFVMEPCATEEYPTPARRPANSILENGQLKKYGLNRMVPWQEDVVAFANQFRAQLLAEAAG
jgi:dTDP-4-dehydrorhamnose reductase